MEHIKEYVGISSDGQVTGQVALGDSEPALTLAGDILDYVYQAYSGYRWFVQVKSGVIFIRELSFPNNWGMVRKLRETDFSASNLKHDVVMSAGEWLERARLKRGLATGEATKRVDGVPEKYQPKIILEN